MIDIRVSSESTFHPLEELWVLERVRTEFCPGQVTHKANTQLLLKVQWKHPLTSGQVPLPAPFFFWLSTYGISLWENVPVYSYGVVTLLLLGIRRVLDTGDKVVGVKLLVLTTAVSPGRGWEVFFLTPSLWSRVGQCLASPSPRTGILEKKTYVFVRSHVDSAVFRPNR